MGIDIEPDHPLAGLRKGHRQRQPDIPKPNNPNGHGAANPLIDSFERSAKK
jgi:hypothetical protein